MTKPKKKNKGLAMHCHHEMLFEYCYDFQERVDYIRYNKPENEIKTRLKLFKLLSPAAIKALPEKLAKAQAEYDKAQAEWAKARAEWDKTEIEKWHEKYCGCKNWNGERLIF